MASELLGRVADPRPAVSAASGTRLSSGRRNVFTRRPAVWCEKQSGATQRAGERKQWARSKFRCRPCPPNPKRAEVPQQRPVPQSPSTPKNGEKNALCIPTLHLSSALNDPKKTSKSLDDGSGVGGNSRPEISLRTSRLSTTRQVEKERERTHSLATGPAMADPFISPLGFTITPVRSRFVSAESRDEYQRGRRTGVVLEVEEDTITTTPRLALANDNSGVDCRVHHQPSSFTPYAGTNVPFFRRSGFPFFTVAITMSPAEAAGSLLRRAPKRVTEITCSHNIRQLSLPSIPSSVSDARRGSWLQSCRRSSSRLRRGGRASCGTCFQRILRVLGLPS